MLKQLDLVLCESEFNILNSLRVAAHERLQRCGARFDDVQLPVHILGVTAEVPLDLKDEVEGCILSLTIDFDGFIIDQVSVDSQAHANTGGGLRPRGPISNDLKPLDSLSPQHHKVQVIYHD